MCSKVATRDERWQRFGRWLKIWRETHTDFTQSSAAAKIGMTRQQWSRVEAGTSGTKRETIIKMAEAIGLDVFQALEQAGFKEPRGDREMNSFHESDFASLYFKYKRLSSKRKTEFRRVLDIIDRELDRLAEEDMREKGK